MSNKFARFIYYVCQHTCQPVALTVLTLARGPERSITRISDNQVSDAVGLPRVPLRGRSPAVCVEEAAS
jgi:hypothetical protein